MRRLKSGERISYNSVLMPNESFRKFIGYQSPFSLPSLGRTPETPDFLRKLLGNTAFEHEDPETRSNAMWVLSVCMGLYLDGKSTELNKFLTDVGLRDPDLSDEDPS